MEKLRNEGDELNRERIKNWGKLMIDCIWKSCNIAFDSGALLEEWRFGVTVPL